VFPTLVRACPDHHHWSPRHYYYEKVGPGKWRAASDLGPGAVPLQGMGCRAITTRSTAPNKEILNGVGRRIRKQASLIRHHPGRFEPAIGVGVLEKVRGGGVGGGGVVQQHSQAGET